MNHDLTVLPTIAETRAFRRALPHGKGGGGGRGGGEGGVLFVPTMGALHEGHASLVRAARERGGPNATVIASVFVNPTQFGPHEDFTRYPRTFPEDCRLLQAAGCDAVFAPAPAEMYPDGPNAAAVTVDPGPLGTVLEGAIRPGHFRGVCTVVAKLLHIVDPTHLLMGQKDYQQQAILRLMVRDLNMPVEFVTCPTIREPDGLAMSSRNRYLSPDQRARAVAIFQALCWAKDRAAAGAPAQELQSGMTERISASGLTVQYALACHAQTLAPLPGAVPAVTPAVLLVAAQLGATRLIDNMLLDV